MLEIPLRIMQWTPFAMISLFSQISMLGFAILLVMELMKYYSEEPILKIIYTSIPLLVILEGVLTFTSHNSLQVGFQTLIVIACLGIQIVNAKSQPIKKNRLNILALLNLYPILGYFLSQSN